MRSDLWVIEVRQALSSEALRQLALDGDILHLVTQQLVVNVARHRGLVHSKRLQGTLHPTVTRRGEVGETAINDCYLFISTGNASSATKVKWTSTDQLHVFWKTPSVFSLPVEGSGLPNKVNLEVVGDFHRCSNTAPQLDGNFIAIVFKHKLLRKSSIMSYQFLISELNFTLPDCTLSGRGASVLNHIWRH